MDKTNIGNRFKKYENVTRATLIPNSYTVIRIDGRAFRTYTKGCDRPFDESLMEDMIQTTKYLVENIQGCKFAYTQSDEISLILTDFDTHATDMWFNGVVQKICSVSASMATMKFNQIVKSELKSLTPTATFDSRVFQLPNESEVFNYLRWRQKDAVKNSITMLAQSKFSHKDLHKKSGDEKQEMVFRLDGTNWNDLHASKKRGTTVHKEECGYIIGNIDFDGDCGWGDLESILGKDTIEK